jgi:leader peptidase (prepilin peptidase) / N-methyltransferase
MLFALPIWFLLVALSILGVIWGSFIAALCSRWPYGESVAKGRSRCDQCGEQIAAHDLIPVASYLLLKGRCRNCGHRIGLLPFATELTAALIGAVPVLLIPESQAVAAAFFGWLLLPLIILDHQHLWLPNRLVLLLAVLGFILGPMLTPSITLVDRVGGLFAGFLGLETVRQVYKQFRQRDGMGAGDPKIFAALGIWWGWQTLPIILLGASAIGLVSVSILYLTANHHRTAFPLGSYLGIAGYVAVLMV